MVGKSLRRHGSKQESSDDEFPSLDNGKKGKGSSQWAEDNDNILDGFDVEGLTEQEKEDLKKAIMDSKNEMPGQHNKLVEEKGGNVAPVDGEQKDVSNIDEDDDDETQPPEDMEEDFGFNLIEPTLVDTDESTEEMIPVDNKATSPANDDKSVSNSNEIKDGGCGSSKSFEPMDDEKAEGCMDSQKSASTPTTTLESNNNKRNLETKSTSRTNSQTDSVGSNKSDDHPKAGCAHVPLQRHYRAVCTQTVKNPDYYFPRDNTVSECSAKAIYQLFEIFRMKLKKAQHRCRDKLPWGPPVKPGSHQSRTIDIKRRGQDSFYLDLSQDSDDEFEKIPKSSRGRPLRKPRSQSPDNSDDDLPYLIVEDTSSIKSRSLRRRKLHDKNMEMHPKTSATRHIDPEGELSDDEFQESKPRYVGKTSVQNKKQDTNFVDNTFGTSDSKRPRKQRSNKKIDAFTKVLVEETQDVFGEAEYVRQSKEDSEITVCETQTENDNIDWLNVRKTAAGERFENPMHQAKLKDYTIRKISHSKRHNKTETVKESFEESLESVGEKREEKDEKLPENERDKDVDVKENQQPVKRKKRKAKKNESKILVEETQDIDVDMPETIAGRKRVKRKCFKLGSSSEEESVADTQDMDYTPEHEADVGDSNLNDNVDKTDDKHCELDEKDTKVCQNNLSENSQSPVIKKSKKSSVSSSKKGGTDFINLDEETEIKTNINENFPCEQKLRTLSGNRTNVRKGRMLKKSALDTNICEKNDVPKGVKKLFNRPVSTESINSNNSDDVSTTSSQRSGMIIDDQGDLYSTQFCEIKGRKRKKVEDSKADSSQTFAKKMHVFEKVMTPDKSDASVPARNMNMTSQTNSKNTSTHDPKVEKSTKNLDKSLGVSSNVPIDIDSDSDGEAEEIVVESRRSQNSQKKTCGNVFMKTTQQRKPIISLNDVATAKELQRVKADINQTACNVKPATREVRTPSASTSSSKQLEKDEDDRNTDSSPDIFSLESDEDPLADIKGSNTQKRVNKKGNVHWTETKVEESFDNHSKDVSHRSGSNRRIRDDEKLPQGRGRKRQRSEDNQEEAVIKEIQTIECPICVRQFPVNVIEAHAADCNGPPMEEEEGDSRTSQSSHDRTENNVRHNRSNHKHRERDISPDDNHHIPLVKQSNIVGEDFNVLKQLSDTGQEDGEPQTCWICERLIKTQYKLHVERCYDEAAKQQREIEEKGFIEVQREPEREVVSPARTTRGRLRQQNDDGDTPRQKVNNVKVTRFEQNIREEGEVTPTRTGRGVGRKRQERTHTLKATSTEDG